MPRRDLLVDALRGLALFGILAVNIQFFVSALASPSLGVLGAASSVADHVAVAATALLLEFKFYPVFSFCFGYGFAVQTRRWRARGEPARQRFSARMRAMLVLGALHGTLLWFGDILSRYAIAGALLGRHAEAGPRRLLAALRFWFAVMLAVTAAVAVGAALTGPGNALPVAHEPAFAFGSYAEATPARVMLYLIMTVSMVVYLPQFMCLFLLGALAAQLNVLRHPERHRALLRRVLVLGLAVGVPVNLVFAWQQWLHSADPLALSPLLATLSGELAPALALAYIAALALSMSHPAVAALLRAAAPAGRIALTLYVAQSLAMLLLLSGAGLGWGAHLGQAGKLALAAVIYLLLIWLAHALQRAGLPGPLEALWRRMAYGPATSG